MPPSSERPPVLILFVDALPAELLRRGRLELDDPWRWGRITPCLGFSVNQVPALFAGLLPDDLGAFNKWTVRDDPGRREPTRPLRRGLDLLTRKPQLLSRALHKAVGKALGMGNIANIPFEYLPWFRRTEPPVDEGILAERYGFRIVHAEEVAGRGMERERRAMDLARDAMDEADRVFLALTWLDRVGHRHGPEAPEFVEFARGLLQGCAELAAEFLARHDDGVVLLCSDHGMSPVDRPVAWTVRRQFGAPGPARYRYFLDATMVRIWTDDDARARDLAGWLREHPHGTLLDAGDREELGLSNPAFGRLIFVLDEGALFWPGWYGGRIPRGMHGYLPHHDWQRAVVAVRGAGAGGIVLPERSTGVAGLIEELT